MKTKLHKGNIVCIACVLTAVASSLRHSYVRQSGCGQVSLTGGMVPLVMTTSLADGHSDVYERRLLTSGGLSFDLKPTLGR